MKRTFCVCTLTALPLAAGCASRGPAESPALTTTLTIGLGSTASAQAENAGLRQVISSLASSQLLNYSADGRPTPSVALQWSFSPDNSSLTLSLGNVVFHDGSPVTAAFVKELLAERLPQLMGPLFEDIQDIRAESPQEVRLVLKQPSRLVIEALDISVRRPGEPLVGTGPFRTDERTTTELRASLPDQQGRPHIDRIVLKPYPSVRAAWADLLRGKVDMLYEVSADALPSLEPSTRARVFSFKRHYQYVLLFNMRRPVLRESSFRRGLNVAIDRERLIAEGLDKRGTPSQGPIWPGYWAAPQDTEAIAYAPRRLADAARPIRLSCLIPDPSHERLGIAIQRQLRSVGVQLDLQLEDTGVALRRLSEGDFDVMLLEVVSAPTILRPYLFWHSKGPYNYGAFASREVDSALGSIRHALDDDAYKRGVAAFQSAILNDPPAIFVAWGERARAISSAFDVPVEPGRDPLATLATWRPLGSASVPSSN